MEQCIDIPNVRDENRVLATVSVREVVLALAAAGVTRGAFRAADGKLVSLVLVVTDAPPESIGSHETPEPDPRLFGEESTLPGPGRDG